MNFVLFVSDKNWRKAVIFVNTQILCRIVPSLIIGCESIDFEIRTSKLLTHMDGHVDKVACYVDAVNEVVQKTGEQGARAPSILLHERFLEGLAKAVLGIPADKPLPDPARKYTLIREAVLAWKRSQEMTSPKEVLAKVTEGLVSQIKARSQQEIRVMEEGANQEAEDEDPDKIDLLGEIEVELETVKDKKMVAVPPVKRQEK